MKESINTTRDMEKVNIDGATVMFIKETFEMIKEMELVKWYGTPDRFMKAVGKMAFRMEQEIFRL